MTDIPSRLEEIRERVEAATEGPWTCEAYDAQGEATGDTCMSVKEVGRHPNPHLASTANGLPPDRQANADFIAAARQDVPFLLSLVEDMGQVFADEGDGFWRSYMRQVAEQYGEDTAETFDALRDAAQEGADDARK